MPFDILNRVPPQWENPILYIEFMMLFIQLPILLYFVRQEMAPYLIICLATVVAWCLLLLLTDQRFKRFRLWNVQKLVENLPVVMRSFAFAAAAMLVASWYLTPDWLFALPREQTFMWVALLILYPLLSAWPQEIIFRTFMFHQ
ncbi:MAG: hypothetical protein HWE10_11820 [Gammaproteobacteria bacterium]|nr:hypothetical protein [Gammaproteobacteria bacterium]